MKVRTHKTIKFRWALTVAGEVVDLTGRNLVVEITTPGKQKVVLVPQIENNVLCFEYKGTQVGTYSMTAYLDRYTQVETMLDECKAFTLVEKTCMEEDSATGDLQYETIELEGSLSMIPMGPKGDRGPIGPQGNPATINGYETLTVTQVAPITIAQVDGTLTIGLDPDKSVTPENLNEEIQNRVKGDNDIKKELGDNYYTKTQVDGQVQEINQNISDLTTDLSNTDTIAKQAKAIAEGKSTAIVFDTVEDMNVYILAHSSTLKVGDIFYIKATDVSDYWWTGTEVLPMETEKPDLSNFYNKTEVDNKIDGRASKEETNRTLETLNSAIEQEKQERQATDGQLSSMIENRVSRDDFTRGLGTKQDTLTPGTGIKIENNVISSTGGGGGSAIWTGTESEYNGLETIDPEIIYIVESN